MIARLLPLVGTGVLLAATTAIGIEVNRVINDPPALPDTGSDMSNASPVAPSDTTSPRRKPRATVYYEAITDRPLFAPSRRPVEAQAEIVVPEPVPDSEPTPPPEPTAPPQVTLHGVITSGDRSRALLGLEGAAPEWFDLNASIAGWTLAEIGPDFVRLTRDTQKFRVDMY